MKANEAPEKIYITNYDIEALPKNEQLSERWHEVSTQDTDIEYTRTDAFIEKACEFLFDEIYNKIEDNYIRNELMEDSYASKIIEDFKNYMKGK